MELKLEHVLLLLLFVFLFRQVKCNRLTEGVLGGSCNHDKDCPSPLISRTGLSWPQHCFWDIFDDCHASDAAQERIAKTGQSGCPGKCEYGV